MTGNDNSLQRPPDMTEGAAHASCTIVVGIGCERLASAEDIVTLVERCLTEAAIAPQRVACIATLATKASEPALQALARLLNVPICGFSAARLEAETPRLANPSDAVFRIIGCHGVAEGAALAAVGAEGWLVLPKRIGGRATCAIARSAEAIDPVATGRTESYDGGLIVMPDSGQAQIEPQG